jgi:hypothetical protein
MPRHHCHCRASKGPLSHLHALAVFVVARSECDLHCQGAIVLHGQAKDDQQCQSNSSSPRKQGVSNSAKVLSSATLPLPSLMSKRQLTIPAGRCQCCSNRHCCRASEGQLAVSRRHCYYPLACRTSCPLITPPPLVALPPLMAPEFLVDWAMEFGVTAHLLLTRKCQRRWGQRWAPWVALGGVVAVVLANQICYCICS